MRDSGHNDLKRFHRRGNSEIGPWSKKEFWIIKKRKEKKEEEVFYTDTISCAGSVFNFHR